MLIKYADYIALQESRIAKARQAVEAGLRLPVGLRYAAVAGLSDEEVEKLEAARPRTFAEAQAISGLTPVGLDLLLQSMYPGTRALRREREGPG